MPIVSVVVPNYNHAPFLARRLDSVLGQTLRDIEVLVLDDASTDDSLEVIARRSPDPRLRVVSSAVNSGSPFVQWNRGVAATTAPLVWIAESDDDADPRLLETLVDRLDRHPTCGVAFAQSLCIDANDRVTGTQTQWTDSIDRTHWLSDYVDDGRAECAHLLAVTNTIPNASAVVFRRAVYADVGGAPESMRLAGDWMTWLRMLLVSDVAFVAEPLNRHRSHDTTVRAAWAGDARWWRETLEVWRFAEAALELPQATRTRIVDILREVMARLLPRAVAHRRLLADLHAFGRHLDPGLSRSLVRLVATRAYGRIAGRVRRQG